MRILLGEIMLEKDITYPELARLSGVSSSTLHRMANGQKTNSIEHLEQIAKALNMRISDLYESDWK